MKKKPIIVAIGGGRGLKNGDLSTRPIDAKIVKKAGKKSPQFLFIPTASSDDEKYTQRMLHHYESLGCRAGVLKLLQKKIDRGIIKKLIAQADIIYVGGGNTLKMMRRWRTLGVDELLREAGERGAILCGASAGSICWFESGHSDSMSYYNPKNWDYIRVRGLGLLPAIHCPHFDSETSGVPRRQHFEKMIQERGGLGLAIEDDCAVKFEGDHWEKWSANGKASAFWLTRKKEKGVCQVKVEEVDTKGRLGKNGPERVK